MGNRSRFEVVIIGAGIAGASLAYFLSECGLSDILLLEREEQLARHSTGRSAASLVELDEKQTVQDLKLLGGRFLRNPPQGLCENPPLQRSGVLALLREPSAPGSRRAISTLERAGVRFELLSPQAAVGRVPELSPTCFEGALFLPDNGRIDVHELLSSYLRYARRRGAELRCGVEVEGIRSERGRCAAVVTRQGEIRASWVVNAAGAWAGRVGAMAGAAPIELRPLRRTIIVFAPPQGISVSNWPFVVSDADHLYFTPESGGVLLSPMDEDPSEPCEPYPDEAVIAAALERLARLAPRLVPRSLTRKWAGLRTFAPDGVPVVGEDPLIKGFFWLAGQGGYGIESSPAVGRIAADLIVGGKTDHYDARLLAPGRFGQA